MRWKKKKPKNIFVWHKWFAWHPVTINEYRYWLCFVERRLTGNAYYHSWWEYEEIDSGA